MAETARQLSPLALEWVKPPQQARSQRTLERLLDAAEELIEERGVDGMTISAIVGRAGSSVGAFYARFGDKETLLRCLFERFYDQARATTDAALDPDRWHDVSLAQAMEATITFVTHVFRERRGVIAALSTQFRDRDAFAAPAEVLSNQIANKLLALTIARGENITRPDAEAAVRTCVWLVLSALSGWAQAGAPETLPPADTARFAADITRMSIGFLYPTGS